MSLELTYDELRQQVGFHLGFGTDPDQWNSSASDTVTMAIRNGWRRFLYSSLVPGTRSKWEWSFLRKSLLLSTRNGANEYDLPDDFGSEDGPLSFTTDHRTEIVWVNEGMIRGRQAEEATGVPSWAAVVATPGPTVSAQKFKLLLHPTPDGAYDLRLMYYVNPEMLSSVISNPHGGAPHARTLLLAILLESAVRVDSSRDFEREYVEALAASIAFDAKRKGTNLGYNGDSSDRRLVGPRHSHYVYYEGVLYDGEET